VEWPLDKLCEAVFHQAQQRWLHDRGPNDRYVLRFKEPGWVAKYADDIRAIAEKLEGVAGAAAPAETKSPEPLLARSRR
jgi:hypothetical protein